MTSSTQSTLPKTAMILSGGTGGHIFPGLAVAEELRHLGWRVVWLGTFNGMESQIVPKSNFVFEGIRFSGIRRKGWLAWLLLPLRLLRACWQSALIIQRIKPNVILGFGGYVTFPAGVMGRLLAKPLILHEQNSIAGLSNRVLAVLATRIFTAFPQVMSGAQWSGNPLRSEFAQQAEPQVRFRNRLGPLKILVLGGSLGARYLNQLVPQALNLLPVHARPDVTHQSGINQIDELKTNYRLANVHAELIPFISNTAAAFADADLVICRSGASTVTELAAVGAAAIFVPLPAAVDDHQTKNAMYLVEKGGGWIQPQQDLTPQKLAHFILEMNRSILLEAAIEAKKMHKQGTLKMITDACEDLTK